MIRQPVNVTFTAASAEAIIDMLSARLAALDDFGNFGAADRRARRALERALASMKQAAPA